MGTADHGPVTAVGANTIPVGIALSCTPITEAIFCKCAVLHRQQKLGALNFSRTKTKAERGARLKGEPLPAAAEGHQTVYEGRKCSANLKYPVSALLGDL